MHLVGGLIATFNGVCSEVDLVHNRKVKQHHTCYIGGGQPSTFMTTSGEQGTYLVWLKGHWGLPGGSASGQTHTGGRLGHPC